MLYELFFIRLQDFTLIDCAIVSGLLEANGFHIIYKKISRRDRNDRKKGIKWV